MYYNLEFQHLVASVAPFLLHDDHHHQSIRLHPIKDSAVVSVSLELLLDGLGFFFEEFEYWNRLVFSVEVGHHRDLYYKRHLTN